MAQSDPGRKEKSQASKSGSLAPESGSDQHTQRKMAAFALPKLRDLIWLDQTCLILVKYRSMKTWQGSLLTFFFFFKSSCEFTKNSTSFLGPGNFTTEYFPSAFWR